MPGGPYLIGIDGGTQSTKVVVFDAEGNVVAEGREPLRPMSRPRHGVAFHPDDDLWDSLAAASRQALERFDGDPARSRPSVSARSAVARRSSGPTARSSSR